MNINHLRYFEEVCKQGSITRASEICHISQPSITAAINGLEKVIGYKLFSRINNRLHLTNEGEEFRRLTADFLKDFSDFQEKVCDLTSDRTVTLRLGVPSIMGTFFFRKIIPDFQNNYPYIHLEIYEIATLDGINMLHNAELDFLLGINSDSCYTSCDSQLIFTTELQLAISKNHPLAQEKKITSEMLSGLPLVIISKGSYHYKAIKNAFHHIALNVIMHSSQLSTIKYMIVGNHAASIIYKDVFANNPDVCCVPLEMPLPAQVHVFWQKNTYLSSAMRTFISYMTKLEI